MKNVFLNWRQYLLTRFKICCNGEQQWIASFQPCCVLIPCYFNVLSTAVEKVINSSALEYMERYKLMNDKLHCEHSYVTHLRHISFELHGESQAFASDISKEIHKVWFLSEGPATAVDGQNFNFHSVYTAVAERLVLPHTLFRLKINDILFPLLFILIFMPMTVLSTMVSTIWGKPKSNSTSIAGATNHFLFWQQKSSTIQCLKNSGVL